MSDCMEKIMLREGGQGPSYLHIVHLTLFSWALSFRNRPYLVVAMSPFDHNRSWYGFTSSVMLLLANFGLGKEPGQICETNTYARSILWDILPVLLRYESGERNFDSSLYRLACLSERLVFLYHMYCRICCSILDFRRPRYI